MGCTRVDRQWSFRCEENCLRAHLIPLELPRSVLVVIGLIPVGLSHFTVEVMVMKWYHLESDERSSMLMTLCVLLGRSLGYAKSTGHAADFDRARELASLARHRVRLYDGSGPRRRLRLGITLGPT
eukprot:scaffold93753_cov28-Tisochrysis_lutea.AAC.2